MTSALGVPVGRPRALWIVLGAWSVAVLVLGFGWLQQRLDEHREHAITSAGLRLMGAKDTLALTLRQLAALPLDLSHRPGVAEFVEANRVADDTPAAGAIQRTLDQLSTDAHLPMVALIGMEGEQLAISAPARVPGVAAAPSSFRSREYFTEAMLRGAAVQFLFGRVSREPGLYFANRVQNAGVTVGVALVKQDAQTLNRLLSDADGARVFVTDSNGVVVLGNHSDMLMRRLPEAPAQPDEALRAVYQRLPEPLAWEQSRPSARSRGVLFTRLGNVDYATVSSPLADTPLRVWVLEPLDQAGPITNNAFGIGAAAWLIGCALIWLSWRRVQLLDAALQARRDLFELAQSLPLTVFRYTRPVAGKPRFAFIGRGADELFGVDDTTLRADPELPWRAAGSNGQPPTRPQEFRVESGGTTTWVLADSTQKVEADGSTTFNGYWLDITLRREMQARFAAVFEHAEASYLFFDAKRGVTHCNPASLRLFGTVDPHALLGKSPWLPGLSADLQADGTASRQRALHGLREHTRTQQRVRGFEWRFRRADGSEFDADVHVIALEWAGTPEFCAVLQDISARKQLQADMHAARGAAEAASRSKSSFLANMSHELRTPMNAIIGMTHLALEDGLPPTQHDYIDKAHHAARNLLQILNDILDVSKIEAGQMTLERIDFELESVVGDMADVLGMKADEKGLELLFSAAPELPARLVGDPTRLRQVLVNLGGNAIKFTEAGEVTVGMEVVRQEAQGIELHAWVRDTGVGMSADDVARLFQPFAQGDASTTRRFGGTGLGLVISRQLVELMGGRLWVESTPGAGSTFHFSAHFGRSAPRAPGRASMLSDVRGQRALLADDNAAALDVLGSMLESFGVQVDRARDAAGAIAMVDAAPDAYTWLLIDWKMPGMDGVECIRHIIARHPALAPGVLLVTGFARDEVLRASVGVPIAGVLHKPVTPSTLHDSLVQARGARPGAPADARRDAAASALAPPPPAPPLTAALRERLAGRRVLLVEDHPLNQQLACELLRRAGVEVVVAVNGQQALERLAADGPFDGVLMDCQMPVMDGYTATRELRKNPAWQRLPVIAMTASALVDDRERALASGMNAHITKPIHVPTMLHTLADWIGPGGGATAAPEAPAPPATPAADAGGTAAVLDPALGLSFCMGDAALYRRLLVGFRASQAGFGAELERAFAEHRWDDARHRAHDLKGLAGTVGAPRLMAAVVALRTALAQGGGPAADAQAQRTCAELDATLQAIDAHLAST